MSSGNCASHRRSASGSCGRAHKLYSLPQFGRSPALIRWRRSMSQEKQNEKTVRRRRSLRFVGLVALVVLATVFGLALLVNIFQRKQEARNPFFRVVELTDDTVDPSVWGKNFPLQYDDYLKTTDQVRTRYGGSEAEPRTPTQADPRSIVAQSRLEEDPRLKIMWAGYAF